MTKEVQFCTWIYPHWRNCIIPTPRVIKCDKSEGVMRKKNGVFGVTIVKFAC